MKKVEQKFYDVMIRHSNAELIEIVTKYRTDYNPDAIIAAEQVIKERQLTIHDFESAKEQIKINEEKNRQKANEPLESHWKILTFIFPAILNIFIASNLKIEGYHRKYKEAWKYTLLGILFYTLLAFLIYFIFALLFKMNCITIG